MSAIRAQPVFVEKPTFEEVVFGDGDSEERYTFAEFLDLPLARRVKLMFTPSRFYMHGRQISRTEAMRFQTQ